MPPQTDPKLTRWCSDGDLGVEVLVHHGTHDTYEIRVAGFVLTCNANPATVMAALESALAELRMARTALSRATGLYAVSVNNAMVDAANAEEAAP